MKQKPQTDNRRSIKIDEETWYVLSKIKLDNRYKNIATAINYLAEKYKELKKEQAQ